MSGTVADRTLAESTVDGWADVGAAGRHPSILGSRWLAALAVAVVSFLSLVRTGVSPMSILAYSAYWFVGVLLPGVLVHRILRGVRPSLTEDLAFGGLTGLALQIIAWQILTAARLEGLVSWWWVAVLVPVAAIPSLRHHWTPTFEQRASPAWAWSMASVAMIIIMRTDVLGFRTIELPPNDSATHLDLWWHLSLIQQLMGSAPFQVPQVVGEGLEYHYFSHVHMAIGANTAHIDPELILFRLWVIPVILVTIGLIGGAARELSGRNWAAPIAAWLVFGTLVQHYLWPDQTVAIGQPLNVLSPSQAFATCFVVAAAAAFVPVARGHLEARGWIWLALVVFVASGMKSTVVPVLVGGTVVAFGAALVTNRRFPRQLGVGVLVLLAVQAWGFLTTAVSWGGRVTVLGTLRESRLYTSLVEDTSLRAVNDGLILDSIDDSRAVFAAAVALVFFFGTSAIRFIGLASLGDRETRSDPAAWWLAGTLASGWAAGLVIDHVSVGQIYFTHTVTPIGILLTVLYTARKLDRAQDVRTALQALFLGLAAGIVAFLFISYVVTSRSGVGGYGTVEAIGLPLLLLAGLVGAGWVAWRRWGRAGTLAGLAPVVVIAATIGIAIPSDAAFYVRYESRWFRSVDDVAVDPAGPWFVSTGEQEAMLWLRDNSDSDDVIVTNYHCRPGTQNDLWCDSRGFWVTGLGGRAAVLETWGYTPEALALNGQDGRNWVAQPTPFSRELELSNAVFADPHGDALTTLIDEYSADWIVGVRRTGEFSAELADVADLAFDNGEVVIYRIR